MSWSPTSRRFAFTVIKGQGTGNQEAILESCDREGDDCSVILSDKRLFGPSGLAEVKWSPDGRIFYTFRNPPPDDLGTNLWSIEVDPDTGHVRGKPVQVTTGTGFRLNTFSQSSDGKRLAFCQTRSLDTVQIAPLRQAGTKLGTSQPLGGESWDKRIPEWTPDGRAILYASSFQGRYGIFKQDVQSHETQTLFTGTDWYHSPVMSPDGRWIFFVRAPSDDTDKRSGGVMRIGSDGGPPSLIAAGTYSIGSIACSPQANLCILGESSGGQYTFSLLDPLRGRGAVLAHTELVRRESLSLSPDGKIVAFVTDSHPSQLQIVALENGSPRSIQLAEGWSLQHLSWSPDNHRLYVAGYLSGSSAIYWVSLDGKSGNMLDGPFSRGWISFLKASPDGRYLAYQLRQFETRVAMLENF